MKQNNMEQLNDLTMQHSMPSIGVTHFQKFIKIKNKRLASLICLLTLTASFQMVSAQTGSVKVTVIDDFEKPLAGVLVKSVSNPAVSDTTNVEGKASLDMLPGGEVLFSYSDMQKTVAINKNIIKVQLNKSDKKINLGFGMTKPVDERTTSLDVVYSDKLEKSALFDPKESLYGQLKGLMVLQNGGEAWNRTPSILIRGKGTTGNNRILVLVDGFERDMSSLSLPEIESVSVLKDGTDLARYGLKGANGVVLVTTKRGEYNSFHVDATYEKGWNMPLRKPKFLDAYGYARAVNQASYLDGNAPVYSNQDLQEFKSGENPFLLPNVNWWNESLKKYGTTDNVNTRFWGGGKAVKYFVSLNYQNERGLIDNTNLDNRYDSQMKYDRLNFRTNLDIDLSKTTKFLVNVSGNIGGRNEPSARVSNIMDALYSVPSAAFPIRTESGAWGGTQYYDNNPVALESSTGISHPNFRTLFADGHLIQDLSKWVKGLSVEAAIAYDNFASFYENKSRKFLHESVTYTRDPNSGAINNTNSQTFGTDTDLAYSDSFGDQDRHATGYGKINYDASWNQNKFSTTFMYQQDKRIIDGQYNTFLHQNFMSSSSYGYKNRYFVDGVVSYGGSNFLPSENRFGFFPAISAGWVISRENFLKNSKSINYLKLRASWGMSGNDIMSANLDDQSFGSGGSYNFTDNNNNSFGGIREGQLATMGLTYENSIKTNIGLDMELFGGLTVNIDAFYDKRENILVGTGGAIPSLIGVATATQNAGEVNNKGIETSLLWKKEVGEFKYFIGGNFTFAKNEIVNMNEEFQPYDYLKQTGNPIGQQYGLQSLGFFQNQADINNSPKQLFSILRPGDVKYKDQNNDGFIDALDVIPMGHAGDYPEIYYGINLGFEMQGLGIDILLQGIANQTLYLNTKSEFWPLVGQTSITNTSAGSWTPETAQTATLPRLTLLDNANNYRKNDIWLTSGDYLKMRHFELYYKFPEHLIKKWKMEKVKLFARGMNVFSIDNINVVDPESIGINYPTLASYHLGIKLEF